MFIPNDYLKEAISHKNLTRIYNEFSVIAHEDPSFSTNKFEQTLEYVESLNILGLKKPFDGRIFEGQENWNEEYWALLVSSLLDNFSDERIKHLKEVSKYLHPHQIQSKEDSRVPKSSKKEIPIALTAGLALTSLVAFTIGMKTTATITGIAAGVIGAYLILKKPK